MRAALDEALRLWPTAPAYVRAARTDTVLGGRYRMNRGDWAMVLLPLLHRDPHVWADPERFDPERFAPGQAKTRPRTPTNHSVRVNEPASAANSPSTKPY